MHSEHVTSATQDALDALMIKYPACPLAITLTKVTTDPLPDSPAVQDTTVPNTPATTAPVENDGWKTVVGKATPKKRRNNKVDNKWAMTTANHTPTMQNGGGEKNTHQPQTNTPTPYGNSDPPPCVCNNEHRNHRFFHRIRIRSTHLRISVNFQRVLHRFR
jgi:hypothetical protein